MRRAAAAIVALSMVGVLATACTGQASPTPSGSAEPNALSTVPPPRDAAVTVTDESVAAAVAALPGIVRTAMNATGVPGVAVGVVHDGKVVFAEGYGVRDLSTGAKVDSGTVFPLASVSKSIGATVVAAAVGKGIVGWDTPVVRSLPEFALSDPWVTAHVTIGDMYAHRSGLYEHAGDELEDIGYSRAEVLNRLRQIPLDPFRSTYAYGNFDITAAAESVSRAAGEDWAALSQRLVYDPLGMRHTHSTYAELAAEEDRAVGHVPDGKGWKVSDPQRMPDAQSPAGGASSSVDDMLIWMRMVLDEGGSAIPASALLPAITPEIVGGMPESSADRPGFYGYGFNVGTTSGGLVDVNHSGAFLLGTGTTFSLLPAAGLGIVVLTNGQANGIAEAISAQFRDLAQYGHARQDWLSLFRARFQGMTAPVGETAGKQPPSSATPAQPLAAYAGTYANDYYGPATVSVQCDGLELRLGPSGRWLLTHWDGDRFVFELDGENGPAGSRSLATFDGNTLRLEFFDQHGLGTFRR